MNVLFNRVYAMKIKEKRVEEERRLNKTSLLFLKNI